MTPTSTEPIPGAAYGPFWCCPFCNFKELLTGSHSVLLIHRMVIAGVVGRGERDGL